MTQSAAAAIAIEINIKVGSHDSLPPFPQHGWKRGLSLPSMEKYDQYRTAAASIRTKSSSSAVIHSFPLPSLRFALLPILIIRRNDGFPRATDADGRVAFTFASCRATERGNPPVFPLMRDHARNYMVIPGGNVHQSLRRPWPQLGVGIKSVNPSLSHISSRPRPRRVVMRRRH